MIDDSVLLHSAKKYDPVKAREYYLRTRKLKGRATGSKVAQASPRQPAAAPAQSGPRANRVDTKSRRAELQAQQAALRKRLERLREVLDNLVNEAQSRSGVKKPEQDVKDAAPETQVDKADRNADQKSRKPLSSKQKSDKARQAKEAYEKEHPNTLSTDVAILKEQVKDIQAKIKRALEDDKQRNNSGTKPASARVRSQPVTSDGPRGR